MSKQMADGTSRRIPQELCIYRLFGGSYCFHLHGGARRFRIFGISLIKWHGILL